MDDSDTTSIWFGTGVFILFRIYKNIECNVHCTYTKFSDTFFKLSSTITTSSFHGVYFVVAFFFFQKSLKLFLLQMMSFQKLVAFVALMVFASQVAMAAPQPEHQPALVLRAPQPPPFKFKSPIHEDV